MSLFISFSVLFVIFHIFSHFIFFLSISYCIYFNFGISNFSISSYFIPVSYQCIVSNCVCVFINILAYFYLNTDLFNLPNSFR